MAVCPPDYSWALNAQNLDPCTLASRLLQSCDHTDHYLPPIQDGTPYPPRSPQTDCSCSSPVYALVSACDDCQNVRNPTWKVWSVECSQTFTAADLPDALQSGFSIPQWAAAFDVDTQPAFDLEIAQQIASPTPNTTAGSITPTTTGTAADTDSTGLTSPSPTPSIQSNITSNVTVDALLPTSILQTAPVDPTPSISSYNAAYSSDATAGSTASGHSPSQSTGSNSDVNPPISANKKSSNKGAIAGGTIGALVLVAILGAGAFWWLIRRRRSRMAPSALYKAAYGSRPPTSLSAQPFRERSDLAVASLVLNNSSAQALYRDEESRSSTPLANYAGPRYSHVPQDSTSGPLETP